MADDTPKQLPETMFGFPVEHSSGDAHLQLGVPSKVEGKINYIRYYEVPEQHNFSGWREMLKALANRFLAHVSRGDSVPPTDDFIKMATQRLDAARDGDIRSVIESDLAVAHMKRGIKRYSDFIDEKEREYKARTAGTEELLPVEKGKSLAEILLKAGTAEIGGVLQYTKSLKRGNGEPDKDGVLAEMPGELIRIPMALVGKGRDALELFQQNRLKKISESWDEIDEVEATMQKIVETTPLLSQLHFTFAGASILLSEHIHAIAGAAKDRAQTMKSDVEYYYEADVKFRAARSKLKDFDLRANIEHLQPEPAMGAEKFLHKPKTQQQIETDKHQAEVLFDLVKDGAALIYDMAKIRDGRPKAVESYKAKVERYLTHERKRSDQAPPHVIS